MYHHLANYCRVAYDSGEGLSFDLDLADFCSTYKLDAIKTLNALKFLEQNEYVAFTESVFLPSRFRFEVTNEELYNFQIQNPGWDQFIKTLLRSYGGSFENYVRLKEFDLARRTGMSTQQVVDGLNQLGGYQLLSYLPQTDKPQINWLMPRQQNDNVFINKADIEARKATYRKKMEAVFAYAEHKRCRSQMLLAYFDEANAAKCGICDVCLTEKRQKNASEIFENITNEIVELLSVDAHNIGQLITSLKRGTEKEKIETLRLLLDAGKIKTDGEKYYL
jgi:ATP-dependent DNA helicase RecQ